MKPMTVKLDYEKQWMSDEVNVLLLENAKSEVVSLEKQRLKGRKLARRANRIFRKARRQGTMFAQNLEVFSRDREAWPQETPICNNKAENMILLWYPQQVISAICYGDFNYGKGQYDIIVCRNPKGPKQKYGNKAVICGHG